MKQADYRKLKKQIRKILEEFKWKSEWSTHSELADFILMELDEITLQKL